MTMGLVGRKCGMTRIFNAGLSTPVSVIEVLSNQITQIKDLDTDGYHAIQVSFGSQKLSRVTKPLAGHYAKAKVAPGRGLQEFRLDAEKDKAILDAANVGGVYDVSLFDEGQYVDLIGTTKGKGFAGTVKRWNFRTQDNSHGNSRSHRVPGSIGQNQTPGRDFKGKKMCGHLGDVRCTVQNLQVVKIDKERNLIMVKGAIPGAPGNFVTIKPAEKKKMQGDK